MKCERMNWFSCLFSPSYLHSRKVSVTSSQDDNFWLIPAAMLRFVYCKEKILSFQPLAVIQLGLSSAWQLINRN